MEARTNERSSRPDYFMVSMQDIVTHPAGNASVEEAIYGILKMLKSPLTSFAIGEMISEDLIFSLIGREGEPNRIDLFYGEALIRQCYITRKPWQIDCFFEEQSHISLTFEEVKELNAAFNFFLYQWGFFDDE